MEIAALINDNGHTQKVHVIYENLNEQVIQRMDRPIRSPDFNANEHCGTIFGKSSYFKFPRALNDI